jgi:hypothetical protein
MKTLVPSLATRRLAACIAAAFPLAAGAASGEFTFVVGQVSVAKANGRTVVPVRGTAVDPGDRISTGANGMAQLTMVDQARLSLRPRTQFVIEAYGEGRDSQQGAVLNLLRGTLRTFTGLLAAGNRERYVMKTRVATVGIRGSGNILYACEGDDCDDSIAAESRAQGAVTVNHTIEGSHAVANLASAPQGTPAQQGGAETLITGPGQTVLVLGAQPPRYIPTPRFIADAATNMAGGRGGRAATADESDTRDYAPSDTASLPQSQQVATPLIGNNGLGFPTIDASGNLSADPLGLRDVVISAVSPFLGQSLPGELSRDGDAVRGYSAYGGGTVAPVIEGGALVESGRVSAGGNTITFGRYGNATLGFFGPGSGAPVLGDIHWIHGPSGYPTYLSDVLTGTATYTLAGGTSPTNQNSVVGTLGSATLNVNFSNRSLGFVADVAIPAQGPALGGSWQLRADNVPISLNAFFASTDQGGLVITNGGGQSSATTDSLSGSFEGSFVGTGLSAAILGYGISDTTANSATNWHFVSGVAALTGPRQDAGAEYREGRVSDATGALTQFVRSYATTNRPDEVTVDAEGRVTSFAAPSAALGTHATYALGSAQVVQSGFDAETGMVWGRWGGGVATATRDGITEQLPLGNNSLHYIFAGVQNGPVALPLTGIATYDVIGSTDPTNAAGQVGTLGSASLAANFNNRTVAASVNISIAGQNWSAIANAMPIYRDQYFAAFAGTPIPGLPNPSPLLISCTPNCGQGATGSFDGFFTGRTGQRAGMMYNLGGNQGAIAYGRRPGG